MAFSGSQNTQVRAAPQVASRARFSQRDYLPDPAESTRLAATLGVMLAAGRAAAGMGVRDLAAAAGCHRWTVWALESGRRRPTRIMLAHLAQAIAPDGHLPLLAALVDAAGSSLRPESANAVRRRARAAARAYAAGAFRLPAELAERIELHNRAAACRRAAYALVDEPGATDDPAVCDRVNRLLDQAAECTRRAGPPCTVNIGGRSWTYGVGW